MQQYRDADYVAVSAALHAREARLLTQAMAGRMIDADTPEESCKTLLECGYAPLESCTLEHVERALSQARTALYREVSVLAPDQRIVEIFQVKYDYHNAKTLLKAAAMGRDPQPLLLPGGRYDPAELAEGWRREELRGCSPAFQAAMAQAKAVLEDSHDPQQADLILDRACYAEMELLARDLDSRFLQRYVRLLVDVANLRTDEPRDGAGGKGSRTQRRSSHGGAAARPRLL